MWKNLSSLTLRLMAATLFLIFFNTIGQSYQLFIPINIFTIMVIAGFGIFGFVILVLFGFMK